MRVVETTYEEHYGVLNDVGSRTPMTYVELEDSDEEDVKKAIRERIEESGELPPNKETEYEVLGEEVRLNPYEWMSKHEMQKILDELLEEV